MKLKQLLIAGLLATTAVSSPVCATDVTELWDVFDEKEKANDTVPIADYNDLKTNYDKMELERDNLIVTNAALEVSFEDLKKIQNSNVILIDEKTKALQELEKKAVNLNQKITDTETLLKTAEKNLEDANNNHKIAIGKKETEIKNLSDQLLKAQNDLKDAEDKLTAAGEDSTDLETERDDLKNQVTNLNHQINTLTTEKDNFEKDSNGKIETLTNRVNELGDEKTALEKALNKANEDLKTANEDLTNVSDELNDTKVKLTDARDKLLEAKNEIADLNKEVTDKDKDNALLRNTRDFLANGLISPTASTASTLVDYASKTLGKDPNDDLIQNAINPIRYLLVAHSDQVYPDLMAALLPILVANKDGREILREFSVRGAKAIKTDGEDVKTEYREFMVKSGIANDKTDFSYLGLGAAPAPAPAGDKAPGAPGETEEERLAREAAEAEAARIAREAEEKRLEEERLAKEEEERVAKEAEEKRLEDERLAKEEEERVAKEAKDALKAKTPETVVEEKGDSSKVITLTEEQTEKLYKFLEGKAPKKFGKTDFLDDLNEAKKNGTLGKFAEDRGIDLTGTEFENWFSK